MKWIYVWTFQRFCFIWDHFNNVLFHYHRDFQEANQIDFEKKKINRIYNKFERSVQNHIIPFFWDSQILFGNLIIWKVSYLKNIFAIFQSRAIFNKIFISFFNLLHLGIKNVDQNVCVNPEVRSANAILSSNFQY